MNDMNDCRERLRKAADRLRSARSIVKVLAAKHADDPLWTAADHLYEVLPLMEKAAAELDCIEGHDRYRHEDCSVVVCSMVHCPTELADDLRALCRFIQETRNKVIDVIDAEEDEGGDDDGDGPAGYGFEPSVN
jgi:hypothetical protein